MIVLAPPVDIAKTLNQAMQLHRSGTLAEAEALYKKILEAEPRHADAQHLLGAIAHQRGEHAQAVSMILTALEWSPKSLEFYSNLGEAYRALGLFDEAILACKRALEANPNQAELLNNLGNALCDRARYDEAIPCYRRALQLKPELIPVQVHLANALKGAGQLGEAIALLRKVVQLRPDYVDALTSLGHALRDQGQHAEAMERFQQVIQRKPSSAEAYCNLAVVQGIGGRFEDAARNFQRALELRPSLITALAGMAQTMGMLVPQWHIPMMNDQQRNTFYYDALKAVITPESNVLEIGTGSGLLAMMAATLGAKTVTTCEAAPVIAATATQIVADNGLTDRVRVIHKNSIKLDPHKDLPAPADVLIAEIFSSEFLGEGVLDSIGDAKRRLVKPGCRVIPSVGSVMIALFGGHEIGLNLAVERVAGFDLRRFNTIGPRKQFVSRNDLRITLLTPPIEAFRFDFQSESHFGSQEQSIETTITKAGKCFGIIQWIRLELGDGNVFENHPESPTSTSSWQYCAYVLPAPEELTVGEKWKITAAHNRRVPWFSAERLDT